MGFPAQDLNPRFRCLSRLFKNFRSHLRPVKSLEILLIATLKRLASAVRFRPWPPSISVTLRIAYHPNTFQNPNSAQRLVSVFSRLMS